MRPSGSGLRHRRNTRGVASVIRVHLVLPRFGGHGVSSDGGDVLVGGGAVVAEALLDALGVVEGFDVVEHGGAELGSGGPGGALVDPGELALERRQARAWKMGG
jgi:hypothetical protein